MLKFLQRSTEDFIGSVSASEIYPNMVILSGTVMSTSQMEERTFRQSPSRISTLAERIDSKLPLEQQWLFQNIDSKPESESLISFISHCHHLVPIKLNRVEITITPKYPLQPHYDTVVHSIYDTNTQYSLGSYCLLLR